MNYDFFTFNEITYILGSENRKKCLSGSVREHHMLVVKGPSGAGKSTLLRILARLQNPLKGECYFNGTNWLNYSSTYWRTKIHYISQKPILFEGTVRDNFNIPLQTKILKQELKSINFDFAAEMAEKLLLPENIFMQDAKTLSGGEAARVAFIRSLLINPYVLLLDEPTSALDYTASQAFYKVLSDWLDAPKHAVILVSHNDDYKSINNFSLLNI